MAIPSNLRARNVMASALRLKDQTDAVAPKDKAKWRKISGPAVQVSVKRTDSRMGL